MTPTLGTLIYLTPIAVAAVIHRKIPPSPTPTLGRADLLAVAGLLLQLLNPFIPHALVAGYLLLGVWLAGRLQRARSTTETTAITTITIGGALNFAAILTNNGMPHLTTSGHADGLKAVPITSTTHLVPLADVIPILGRLVSIGDLVLLAGAGLLTALILAPERPTNPANETPPRRRHPLHRRPRGPAAPEATT